MSWMNYKNDSKFHENPFISPKSIGGKGFFKKADYNIYLGGSVMPRQIHIPIPSPLQPPKARYNSTRLATERVFFD